MRWPLVACVVTLALLGSTACGYSTKRLDALGGRTIAVLPFANETFRRDQETRFTETLLTEMRARTSYGIALPGQADYVMSGTLYLEQNAVLQNQDRTLVQGLYRARAHVVIRAGRQGRVVREYDVHAVTEYTPDSGGESLMGSASDTVFRRLAIRVVQGLERDL